MDTRILNYIEEVCSSIRYQKAVPYIRAELEDHILTSYEKAVERGVGHEDAVTYSLRRMGAVKDCVEGFNQACQPTIPWELVLPVGILIVFHLLLLLFCYNFSPASLVLAAKWMVVSCAALLLGCFFDTAWILKYSSISYIVCVIGLLGALLFPDMLEPAQSVVTALFPLVYVGTAYKNSYRPRYGEAYTVAAIILPVILACMGGVLVHGGILLIAGLLVLILAHSKEQVISRMFMVSVFAAILLALFILKGNPTIQLSYSSEQIQSIVLSSKLMGPGRFSAEAPTLTEAGLFYPAVVVTTGSVGLLAAIGTYLTVFVQVCISSRRVNSKYGRMLIYTVLAALVLPYILYVTASLGIAAPLSPLLLLLPGSMMIVAAFMLGLVISVIKDDVMVLDEITFRELLPPKP